MDINRRRFLNFMGQTSALTALSTSVLSLPACRSTDKGRTIKGLQPTFKDDLVTAEELNYHIIAQWGDIINKKGDVFGSHCDFNCFLPLENKTDEGLLWVNHESMQPEFIQNKDTSELSRSKKEIRKEQLLVGGSILHLKKSQNKWSIIKNSQYNRRLHGRTKIPFSHGYSIQGSKVALGTVANCSGGITPWKTFLSSEENYDTFYGDIDFNNGKRTFVPNKRMQFWFKQYPLPPEHYGWVVEINPYTGKAKKQVLLGRAAHEGATTTLTKSGKAIVYMGEDRTGGFIFKFISTGKHFNKGTLYAADTINGRWLPLDINKNPNLKKHFKTQLEVLTYSHKAASVTGATPQDRPEDIEIDPRTNNIYIALTKNPKKNNFYGSLLKIKETNDYDSLTFNSNTWINGGLSTTFACPDNFTMDSKGNLWMTVDMSERKIGKPEYKKFGNNGLFYIPTSGKHAGIPVQVASAPVDAEFTGPWFSPDYKTLFLSVQHPGGSARDHMKKQTSSWPNKPGELPRSAVVALQGTLLDKLT